MLKLKGVYEWKLTDADGNVVQEGSQPNVISDVLINLMFGANAVSLFADGMAIQISDTTPTVGVDYRIAGASNGFNILATGSTDAGTGYSNWTLNSKYCDNNFAPPASVPRTIRVIGVKVFSGTSDIVPTPNFVSFIELSTPITQNTNHYLYVKYTVFVSFDKTSGYNTPNNRFTEYALNQCLFSTQIGYMARPNSVVVTPFIQPNSANNLGRDIYSLYNLATDEIADVLPASGSPYGTAYSKTFAVANIPGPIGTVINRLDLRSTTDSGYQYMKNTYGYSPVIGVTGSVSRVFSHPSTRDAYIFSDPSHPALSQGTVAITGDATNKYPIIGRIRITKTGDASDLTDETVNYTGVDTGSSQITIAQNFATGDKYQITTTGTLPSPLSLLTDYYIIWKDATHIQVALSYADSLAGTYITLTTQGSGDHTFIRQNTGKYRLEMEPWFYGTTTPFYLTQLPMAQDIDDYVMPIDLTDTTNTPNNYGEGDYIANVSATYQNELFSEMGSYMIRGATRNGDYVYTVQQSRKGLINNVCRWLFNSIETSQPLCKFGTGTTKVVTTEGVTGGSLYIATNDGVYKYDYASPTGAPALLTITGGISSTITDMCIDPVTGYMWTGHTSGLSRVDLSTLTATQYINGTGNALDGLTANEVNIQPGQLSAYNGRILRSGAPYTSATYGNYATAWLMVDGVGWYKIGSVANYGGAMKPGTNNVMLRLSSTVVLYDVTVTGVGTGTATLIETKTGSTTGTPITNYAYMFNDTYIGLLGTTESTKVNVETYKVGSNVVGYGLGYTNSNYMYGTGFGWAYGAFNHNRITLDEGGLYGIVYNSYFITTTLPAPVPFGWNAGTWQKDLTTGYDRNIPKTTTHTLLNGLSVNFNNAVGSSWDVQFISGESFNFVHGPYRIKDNLQVLNLKYRTYYCASVPVADYSVSVPASAPYTALIPEAAGVNFRDMDNVDFVTKVYYTTGSAYYSVYTLPSGNNYSVDTSTDILTVGISIATGTPLVFTTSSIIPVPLKGETLYFAINYSSTQMRVATSYANAIAGTYINFTSSGSGTQIVKQVAPSTGTYYAAINGYFVFSDSNANNAMLLTYTYTLLN